MFSKFYHHLGPCKHITLESFSCSFADFTRGTANQQCSDTPLCGLLYSIYSRGKPFFVSSRLCKGSSSKIGFKKKNKTPK